MIWLVIDSVEFWIRDVDFRLEHLLRSIRIHAKRRVARVKVNRHHQIPQIQKKNWTKKQEIDLSLFFQVSSSSIRRKVEPFLFSFLC